MRIYLERRCIDRDNKVIKYLNEGLTNGIILDVGAGNGHYVKHLCMAYTRPYSDRIDGLRMEIIEFLVQLMGQVSWKIIILINQESGINK